MARSGHDAAGWTVMVMMKEQFSSRWFLSWCAAIALAAPLIAQDLQAPAPPTAQDQQVKYRLQTFEGILRSAVKHGAEAFAQTVSSQLPNVQLTSDDPEVLGFAPPTPDGGLMFLVVVPEVRELFFSTVIQMPRPSNNRPVAVGPQSVATPDPMTASPLGTSGSTPPPFNPNLVYTKSVCEALIDAMLDNSGGLPLKDSEWLTIAAIDAIGPTPGAVNSPFGHTTYLSIKGSDLTQLRQGKISRDEARKLVVLKQL